MTHNFLKNNKTAIPYQGGAYGSYVKWVLYYLLINDEIIPPFASHGTSHNWDYLKDKHVAKKHVYVSMIKNNHPDYNCNLFTLHPVLDFGDEFISNLDFLYNAVDYCIVPYADKNTYLLNVHNYIYKVHSELSLDDGTLAYINRDDLLNGWGISHDIPILEIPPNIQREYFSYNIFDSWEAQCNWFAPDHYNKPNLKWLYTSDLLYNFEQTFNDLANFLNISWVRDIKELVPYHNMNLSNQRFLSQDKIAQSILDSIDNDTNISWDQKDLTIFTEAFIQKSLRDKGILLKCNNLDVFPTSTKELIKEFE